MRKVKINDNEGKSIEVDIDEFKKHLDEYHSSGSSVHDEDGHLHHEHLTLMNDIHLNAF